jgi:pyruvate/2-oxoglutarate/acetoin dehydrogenase E1 component
MDSQPPEKTVRAANTLNQALHGLFAAHPNLVLLGEDIADPYGGAFGITRGLSSAYPGRVFSTPISEGGIVGAAGGLALCGDWVVVEVMFGDFITLCFDPLVNFISKSVSMYGKRNPMPVVIRCPVGGNRGYGPTHSQSLQKHFIGVPHLNLYEFSPFHDPRNVIEQMFSSGEPGIFFEDKVLYTQPTYRGGLVEDFFQVSARGDWAWIGLAEEAAPDRVILAPGGLSPRVLKAMRDAMVDEELRSELLVPSKLFPLDLDPVLPLISRAERIVVAEDGVAGGGWASEVARTLYERLWGRLRNPIRLVRPPCAVIPAAPHLERQMLVQAATVHHALKENGDVRTDGSDS